MLPVPSSVSVVRAGAAAGETAAAAKRWSKESDGWSNRKRSSKEKRSSREKRSSKDARCCTDTGGADCLCLLHLMPPRWENKRHAKSGNERRDPSADQAHPDVTQEIPRCPSRGPLRPAVSQHIAFPDVQRRKQNIA